MNEEVVEKIAQAVLYEGYILYPYRPSVKNQHRWTFGGLYPKAYSESMQTGDPWSLLAECIILGSEASTVEAKARFLHLIDRKVAIPSGSDLQSLAFVDSVSVGGKKYQRWQEAMERAIAITPTRIRDIIAGPLRQEFSFPASRSREEISNSQGQLAAVLIRDQHAIAGTVEISAGPIGGGAFKLSVRIANSSGMGEPLTSTGEGSVGREYSPTASPSHAGNVVGEYAHPTQTAPDAARTQHENTGGAPVPRGMGGSPMSFDIDDGQAPPQPSAQPDAIRTSNENTGGPPVPRQFSRDEALMHALVSTHAILGVDNGRFISMTDPPDEWKDAAAACNNVGVWPVLVGEAGAADAILASPIILYDYPQIAPESPGDLFDGGEIDEILSLRILTLTDEEKRDVSSIDPRTDLMLKRTENLAREQLMNLHGGMRNTDPFPAADVLPAWDPMADRPKLPSIRAGGVELHAGDRVRLRPKGGADAFDMMLDGKIATIAVIEQDYEDRIHLAVTVDDDPGADFGVAGKPGHRFFFRPDEVEPI
ncbi:MAG TPA: hypothetical protein VFE47_00565 [Tepidisphaeraceae bacterium]|jgi:hypothetical protein|nr:hypothetical protein [Tepidisphaeraceae bacterium]